VDAATVVWITSAGAETPRRAEEALDEWGRSRGLRLSAPVPTNAVSLRVDQAFADGVEDELEKARDATSALDAEGAERSLARAEGTLRRHPELPQAAWLMAEVERGWARRWASVPPKEPERAAAAWRRARTLDGGREPGAGETATTAADPEVSFELYLDDAGQSEVRLDGHLLPQGLLRRAKGEHQLTVTRRGAVEWAGWIGVAEGVSIRVAPPAPLPCSSQDLSRVVLDEDDSKRVRANGVRCERWVVAEPRAAPGELLVASCTMDRCGVPLEWSLNRVDSPTPAEIVRGTSRWPAWATWTLIGLGAAAITGATLGIDAAFHAGSSSPPFVVGGGRPSP
jgi:hypothetical protein